MLVPEGIGFVKKGTKSVRARRPYSGTAGRIENSRIGVFLGCISRHGHALIDRDVRLSRMLTDRSAGSSTARRSRRSPGRSAIVLVTAPGAVLSAIIAAFSAALRRRRHGALSEPQRARNCARPLANDVANLSLRPARARQDRPIALSPRKAGTALCFPRSARPVSSAII